MPVKSISTLRIGGLIIFAVTLAFIRPASAFALRESRIEITVVEFQLVAIPVPPTYVIMPVPIKRKIHL